MSVVTYTPAALDDATLASDLMTAAYPSLPQDPVVIRYRWANPRLGYVCTRFLAYDDRRPIALMASVHAPWEKLPDRHCEIEVWLDRALHGRDLLDEMYRWIEKEAAREGARLLLTYSGEDEPDVLASLEACGYTRERTEKAWQLDLHRHGPELEQQAADARSRLEREGIKLRTVAEWDDPEAMRKLYELNEDTLEDVPHTLPIVREQFEDFEKRVHAPDRRTDRWWIAIDADRPVAMSFLKFPPIRGAVLTGYTCTHTDYRGRGIARAVKLQSLAQAAALGVPIVCTMNDAENAPMLHINEQLGYVRRPGFVEHHKRVESNGG